MQVPARLILILVLLLLLLPACRDRGEAPPAVTPTATRQVGTPTPDVTPTLAATVTATPTAVVTPAPQRVQFAPGATSATLKGEITPGARQEYLFWAQADQVVAVTILSANGAANFAVSGVADSMPYKRLENENRSWQETLVATQDYRLVVATTEATSYELTLRIEPVPATLPPTASAGLAAIYDTHTGGLLGGVDEEGAWVDVAAVASRLQGEETYAFYLGAAEIGKAEGGAPVREEGICTSYLVTMTPESPHPLAVGISGATWDVAPRPLNVVEADDTQRAAVAALLQENGLDTTAAEVALHDTWSVDLDGDGREEVVTSAAQLLEGGSMPPVAAGDYALVAILTPTDDGWEALPVVLDVYPEAQELAYPWRYKVPAALDLNGDGRLELVITGVRWEGRRTTVYAWDNGAVQAALSGGCAP